jgi:opacity protein-like surface antigen
MPLRCAALWTVGLLGLGACASSPLAAQASARVDDPKSPEAVAPPAQLRGPSVASDEALDLASSIAAVEARESAVSASPALQGPGPNFKPQPSLGTSRLLFGYQDLDEDYWQPADGYWTVGMETSFERLSDWVGGEGGWLFTMQDERDTIGDEVIGVDRTQVEIYFGFHRTFLREAFLRPYVGAGGAFLWIEADQEIGPVGGVYASDKEREWALGAYAHAGVSLQLSSTWQVGVDYRALVSTPIDVLAGDTGDANYTLLSVFIGFGG